MTTPSYPAAARAAQAPERSTRTEALTVCRNRGYASLSHWSLQNEMDIATARARGQYDRAGLLARERAVYLTPHL